VKGRGQSTTFRVLKAQTMQEGPTASSRGRGLPERCSTYDQTIVSSTSFLPFFTGVDKYKHRRAYIACNNS
jgi:hypothetical protein